MEYQGVSHSEVGDKRRFGNQEEKVGGAKEGIEGHQVYHQKRLLYGLRYENRQGNPFSPRS